jgi:hypothetical protein
MDSMLNKKLLKMRNDAPADDPHKELLGVPVKERAQVCIFVLFYSWRLS